MPIFPWLPWRRILIWHRTWYAPCSDVTTKNVEFVRFEVPKGTADRLVSDPVQPAKLGNAMRVEVRPGDWAWNPDANNGAGAQIPGGWRAEAQGPSEFQTAMPVHYEWSTMLDPGYANDPRIDDPNDPNLGKPIWQVIFQWHQGETDQGSVPPVAFIIVGDSILLDLHRHDPGDPAASIQVGQWSIASLDRGIWHDFAADIRWHQTEGSVRVWHNGIPVTFSPQVPPDAPTEPKYPNQPTETLAGLETLFPPQSVASGPAHVYMKLGLYRKAVTTTPAGPFVLYHDEISRSEPWIIWLPWWPWRLVWWWPWWCLRRPWLCPWRWPWRQRFRSLWPRRLQE
jgi:hypothetical protein